MTTVLIILLSFALSAVTGAILIPRIVLTAKRKRLFDQINNRTVHSGAISRLGGVAFYPAILMSFCVSIAAAVVFIPEVMEWQVTPLLLADILLFVAGSVLIFVAGLYDDLMTLGYKYKFAAQFLAALLVVVPISGNGDMFGFFGIHAINPVLCSALLVLAVVFLINAYNLIDGVDGLCAGISILSLLAFTYLFGRRGDIFIPTMAMGAIGVLSVFIRYNVFSRRMKIFMGDSGSLFLGYLIAFMTVNYIADKGTIINFGRSSDVFAVAFGALFVPAFDALRLFVIRLSQRKSPFMADKNHIHHKFLSLGFSHRTSTLYILFFHAAIIILNISVVINFNNMATWVVLADIAIGALLIATLNCLIARKEHRANA